VKHSGRRVIVTGAARGLGRAMAARFIAEGASVLLVDIDPDALTATAAELGEHAGAHLCDVSDEAQIEAAVAEAVRRFGGLDVLVNNAGIEHTAPLVEQDAKVFDQIMGVNLRGVFLGMKHAGPAIGACGGGAIVNISSIAALGAIALHSAYSAAKAGTLALTRCGAIELRPLGVRVNAVCPGIIRTDMVEQNGAAMAAELGIPSFDDLVGHLQGRMGEPEDIAGVVSFLASDDAALMSGVVTPVDGGIVAKAF
jgi:NAD(P)-dependent dehydrogenase (short-subunit alcohol dehydrogenase family)